jgi:hypothetical protein
LTHIINIAARLVAYLRHLFDSLSQLVGICWSQGLVFVATELMAGGSLLAQLENPSLRYHARFVVVAHR